MDVYYAKSKLPGGGQPTVGEHLAAVAELAERFGTEFGHGEAARVAGLLHDFGKYSAAFQGVLDHTRNGIDHALPGAALLLRCGKAYAPVIEAICGHHSGLASFLSLRPKLLKSQSSEARVETVQGKTVALAGPKQYETAFAAFRRDFPDFSPPRLAARKVSAGVPDYITNVQKMLYTRLLFSCLVDADYTVSASDENAAYPEESENTVFDPAELLRQLEAYRMSIRTESTADTGLNRFRDTLYDTCGESGERCAPGVFTLTAPTGTGKTLALLHFALRHCLRWNKRRIILVLPYLTLTEQSAETYRKILPHVLEDHSQSDLSDRERMFTARWRYPVIITTSVRFFESLFSATPADCRKLHNIANSVILFDEAQSLPPSVTGASLIAGKELSDRYGCTMVFSTATQPDFAALPLLRERWNPVEILPDYPKYYQALKRTHISWEVKRKTPFTEIAARMCREDNVCAIVNLRKHARALYRLLEAQCPPETLFLISTDLCPAHRSEIIACIQQRQKNGQRCVVVSTQCIEAGVDLDFDTVFRALAPLDSVIQAAGRCNRNGKKQGSVVVFVPDEPGALYPQDEKHWYQSAAETTRRLTMDRALDIHDPGEIRRYFQAVFHGQQDSPALEKAVLDQDYQKTAAEYQLIRDMGIRIVVPYAGEKRLYDEVLQEARNAGVSAAWMRKAAPITVSAFVFRDLDQYCERLPYVHTRKETGDGVALSGYYTLRSQYESLYSAGMGLQFPDETEGAAQIF